jgi:hypothetical protein
LAVALLVLTASIASQAAEHRVHGGKNVTCTGPGNPTGERPAVEKNLDRDSTWEWFEPSGLSSKIGYRRRTGQKLQWDAENLKVSKCPEANEYIQREYRKGWIVKPVLDHTHQPVSERPPLAVVVSQRLDDRLKHVLSVNFWNSEDLPTSQLDPT